MGSDLRPFFPALVRLMRRPGVSANQTLVPLFLLAGVLAACSWSGGASTSDPALDTAPTLAASTVPASPDTLPVGMVDTGRLAFNSPWDGDYEIFVLDFDLGEVRRLTDNDVGDHWPDWSPDGHHLVFYSDRDGDFEIYLMDENGGDVRQLTDNEVRDSLGSWSPDGRTIAFNSDRDGDEEIYLMDADGGNIRQLTHNVVGDFVPVWSPDGEHLAFASVRSGSYQVWVMNSDGSEPNQLTFGNSAGFPVWSSTSDEIAFDGWMNEARGLFIVDASQQEDTKFIGVGGGWPVWSPDDKRIAFTDGDGLIVVADPIGSNPVSTLQNGYPVSWHR